MSGWEDNGEKREVIKKGRKRRVCAIMNYVYTCMMILFWLIFLGFMCRECVDVSTIFCLIFVMVVFPSPQPFVCPPRIHLRSEGRGKANRMEMAWHARIWFLSA